MSEIQPSHRFALLHRKHSLPLGKERRALDLASYWESFPRSYSEEQVEAARALMLAVGKAGYAEALIRVVALMDQDGR